MLFLKMFMEFDVLFALFVLVELLVPAARRRPIFPLSKKLLRRLRLLPPRLTPGDRKATVANRRLHDAEAHLEAAKTELKAARLERDAIKIENESTVATSEPSERNPTTDEGE
jgi:hypothetical protein